MSPERDQAELLLAKARESQAVLGVIAADESLSDSAVGFHAQQAVELAMKSVLALQGVDYPWTHDLQLLIAKLESAGVQVPESVAEARVLTPWAVAYRYDETPDERIDRGELGVLVSGVVDWAAASLA